MLFGLKNLNDKVSFMQLQP